MQPLTPNAEQAVLNMSQRYGVSVDAVKTLLLAVSAGGGTMAQFYHSELGGGGQWMRGGMTMVGDMFNSGLQSTVSGLCSELSDLLSSQQVFPPATPAQTGSFASGSFGAANQWWPSELGSPSSSGGQNDSRYAYFPQAQRLAIQQNGQVRLYDTLNHQIGGVQQQQGGYAGSLSFSSQFGTFTVDSLPLVSPAPEPPAPPAPEPQNVPQQNAPQQGMPQQSVPQQAAPSAQSQDDVLATLERLGALYERGVLSESEFQSKKAELLSRL